MRGTHKLVVDPESRRLVWVENRAAPRREVDAPMVSVKADRHFTAYSQPRAKRVGDKWVHANPAVRRCDDQGRPQFDSMREVREYVSASGDISDHDAVTYGED